MLRRDAARWYRGTSRLLSATVVDKEGANSASATSKKANKEVRGSKRKMRRSLHIQNEGFDAVGDPMETPTIQLTTSVGVSTLSLKSSVSLESALSSRREGGSGSEPDRSGAELSAEILSAPTTAAASSKTAKQTSDVYGGKPHQTTSSMLTQRQELLSDGLLSAVKYEAQDRIERRRSRPNLADVEFHVGMTERLLPELPRLGAISELHHSDCAVTLWDEETLLKKISSVKEGDDDSLGGGLQVGNVAPHEAYDQEESFLSDSYLSSTGNLDTSVSTPDAGLHDKQQQEEHETNMGASASASASVDLQEAKALRVLKSDHPWMPVERSYQLNHLSKQECRELYTYLRVLRGASNDDVAAELSAVEAANSAYMSTLHAIVHSYLLAGAPSPTMPFSSPAGLVDAPAFTFHLYSENVSTQNAIGHLAALFSVPVVRFITNHVASKMSSCTVLCAVASHTVTKLQLLLINTMRHPGFVLRISNILEVTDRSDTALFGDIARSSTLTEVSLLLRHVSGARKDIEKRLDVLRDVGSIFYCANREASLVRAATDILHGHYRSAMLNALYRKKCSEDLRRFLRRPCVELAKRARTATTDSSLRQLLKRYIRSDGNFRVAVQQAPYVLRRRWINALRSHVWNTMASLRIRCTQGPPPDGGSGSNGSISTERRLRVRIGDVILKPEYRHDVHVRMVANVKACHLQLCKTEEEAQEASLDDVFIPFFRGVFPEELFAPEDTNHPIMTRTAITRTLKKLHALQLLTGVSEECRRILDIRADASPMLFRRLLIRPTALEYSILEDRPSAKSMHYDAARQVLSRRLELQLQLSVGGGGGFPVEGAGAALVRASETAAMTNMETTLIPNDKNNDSDTLTGSLVSREHVLHQTSFAANLSRRRGSGEEEGESSSSAFFTVPGRENYVVLGRAHRDLDGAFVRREPLAADVESFDRVYTVHLRMICRNGCSGAMSMLREYFALGGVLSENISQLQHKIHRTRRELDEDTPLLTAPQFCPACFNICHDEVSLCAEYQSKVARREDDQRKIAALETSSGGGVSSMVLGGATERSVAISSGGNDVGLRLRLTIRRASATAKWGVDMSASTLVIMRIPDPSVISGIAIDSVPDANTGKLMSAPVMLRHVVEEVGRHRDGGGGPLAAKKQALRLDDSAALALLAWRVVAVDNTLVSNRRDLAIAFAKKAKTDLTITLSVDSSGLRQWTKTDPQVALPPHPVQAPLPREGGGVLSVDEVKCLERLPTEVLLVLTRLEMSNTNGPTVRGWGVRVSRSSLRLLNVGSLLQQKDTSSSIVAAVTIPPLSISPGGAAVMHRSIFDVLDGATPYVVTEVQGKTVSTIEDLLPAFQANEETSLVLKLRRTSSVPAMAVESISRGMESSPPSTDAFASRMQQDVLSTFPPEWTSTLKCSLPLSTEENSESSSHSFPERSMVSFQSHHAVEPCYFSVTLHRDSDYTVQRKWGIRLEADTVRLKELPGGAGEKDTAAYCEVFAAKPSTAHRIRDVLTAATLTEWASFACYILGVNQQSVHNDAAAVVRLLKGSQDESVSLQCVRLPLPVVRVAVSRTSTSVPWGLRLRESCDIESVASGSPMCAGLKRVLASLGPHRPCLESLSRLSAATPNVPSTAATTSSGPSVLDVDDDDDVTLSETPNQKNTGSARDGQNYVSPSANTNTQRLHWLDWTAPKEVRWRLVAVQVPPSVDDVDVCRSVDVARSTASATDVVFALQQMVRLGPTTE